MHSITNIFTKDENANTNGEIQTICGVECYEKDGTAYLKLETVARGLGFTREKNGTEYVMWDRVMKYLTETGFHTCVENGIPTCRHSDYIPENIFYRLAMKAKYIEAFNAMESELKRIYTERQQWQIERDKGVVIRHILTDTIKMKVSDSPHKKIRLPELYKPDIQNIIWKIRKRT